MPNVTLKILKLDPAAILPRYEHPGDAGLDLFALKDYELLPGDRQLIQTGIALELPPHTEAQIRPRSGLALKHGITVLNSPGTIDAGYRGEIGVILINLSQELFTITAGMKIAQMVIAPVLQVNLETVNTLSKSQRGEGGFGSSGV
ncbi:MAG: dUTP diphosphatase [Synechocystis sp.]